MPRRHGTVSRREAVRTAALAMAGLTIAPRLHAGGPAPQGASGILIRGGRVVNADGIVNADVRIVGETIAEVGPSLSAGAGVSIIDARGRLVMPGGIDPHTHLHPSFVDDLTTGSRAALAGGITTVGTFAFARRDETPLTALDRLSGLVRQQAIADVFLHTGLTTPPLEFAKFLPELAARGQPSFKVFMPDTAFATQIGAFVQLLEAARDAGVIAVVHCEDSALLAAAVRRLQAEGRISLAHYGESRPVIAELAATQQIAALGGSTRAPIHVVHLSSARALDACRAAKRAGVPLTVETRPLYIHLSDEAMRGPDAPLFVGQPPLRPKADVEAMWAGLLDGSIDFLATDHAPWRREQKMDPALNVARVRPGVSNLQHMLPMYFSEATAARGLSIEQFVATTSTNAAKRFGLFPRKGVIRAGSDADVVVWDATRTAPVRGAEDLSNADYSVYEGRSVTGWPVVTIRRGQVVCEGLNVTGTAGSGKLITRERWKAT